MNGPAGYEIGSPFAKDRTGVLYRAHQRNLDRAVTFKILRPEQKDETRARALFEEERRLVTGLEHPHVLLTIDTGETHGLPWFVTESVAEPTLQEALRAGEPLVESRAVKIALGLARALYYLEGRGLIYKNLRPAHVLLPRPAAPKLLTFRNVRALAEAASFRGANVQSAHYCAPELVREDLGPVTPKANVYALGCLLYEMLAGAPPVEGSSAEARAAHAAGEISPLKSRKPFLRDRAYSVVGRLLASDPLRRVDPAAAVALLEAYDADPLMTHPLQPRRRRRRR